MSIHIYIYIHGLNLCFQLIKQCEDEELMEIVLPRLATVITVWEFLLMKVEKGRPSKPQIPDIFKEFENLHKRVQKICQKYLVPVTERDGHLEGSTSSRLNVSISMIDFSHFYFVF